MKKDLVIIGGGPGGYIAAIRGAKLGLNVLLVEKDSVGGTCLNRGCIPTKTLCKNAEVVNSLKEIDKFGISLDRYSIDYSKMLDRKNKVVSQLVEGIKKLLKANGVDVIRGEGSFKDKNTVFIKSTEGENQIVEATNVIIATGSIPFLLPIPGVELEGVITSDKILDMDTIPGKLVIVGGGVVGMEFASIFNSLGSKVSVVEFLPNLLSTMDKDIVKRYSAYAKKQGIDVHVSSKVTKIEETAKGLKIIAEGKKGEFELEGDNILISAGRVPYVEGLNLEALGINYDRQGIKVNENYQTKRDNIYAIGDAIGGIMLAHSASFEGEQAIYHIAKKANAMLEVNIPSCIFVTPEIATVGLTEEQVKARGINYKTSKFMFGANGKALAMGEGEGFVKIIAESDTGKIIGVHILGPHASDLIHEAALAINCNLNVEDIEKTVHAHPTLSESFYEAVLGIKGEAIHMSPLKR